MRFKQVGNKRDIVAVVIYNDDTANIPVGAPVVLSLSGTQDGLAVVLPSTATNKKQSTFAYGVCLGNGAGQSVTLSGFGEAQVFGLNSNVKLLRTRATSTDPYVSVDVGALLLAESVSNCFATVASNGASAFIPNAALAFSIASIASTAASTATGFTSYVVGFLRMM